jgi:hypothetical protein
VNIEAARNLVEISHLNGVKICALQQRGCLGDVQNPPADEKHPVILPIFTKKKVNWRKKRPAVCSAIFL